MSQPLREIPARSTKHWRGGRRPGCAGTFDHPARCHCLVAILHSIMPTWRRSNLRLTIARVALCLAHHGTFGMRQNTPSTTESLHLACSSNIDEWFTVADFSQMRTHTQTHAFCFEPGLGPPILEVWHQVCVSLSTSKARCSQVKALCLALSSVSARCVVTDEWCHLVCCCSTCCRFCPRLGHCAGVGGIVSVGRCREMTLSYFSSLKS